MEVQSSPEFFKVQEKKQNNSCLHFWLDTTVVHLFPLNICSIQMFARLQILQVLV